MKTEISGRNVPDLSAFIGTQQRGRSIPAYFSVSPNWRSKLAI
jgi:hypothetical protein